MTNQDVIQELGRINTLVNTLSGMVADKAVTPFDIIDRLSHIGFAIDMVISDLDDIDE